MNRKQFFLLTIIVLVVVAYLVGGGQEALNIHSYQDMYQESPQVTLIVFFLIFFLGTALSLPLYGILATLSGVIFGNIIGFPLALLAGSLGGTLAYFSSRFILHDVVQNRFGDRLRVINRGLVRDGTFYLFSLRMIAVIPFWLLNLLMGLTPVTGTKFFLATMSGMAPITLILVYFGSQVGNIEQFSIREVLSPGLLFSLALLALLPFITRTIVRLVQRQKNDVTD